MVVLRTRGSLDAVLAVDALLDGLRGDWLVNEVLLMMARTLRRLDYDEIYSDALGTVCGVSDLESRPAQRVHVWSDPALAQ